MYNIDINYLDLFISLKKDCNKLMFNLPDISEENFNLLLDISSKIDLLNMDFYFKGGKK